MSYTDCLWRRGVCFHSVLEVQGHAACMSSALVRAISLDCSSMEGHKGRVNGSGQASIYISNQRKAEWGPVQALSNNPPARTTEEAQENHLLRVHPQWPHLLKLPQHFPTPTLSGWSCQSQWLLGDTQTSANHSTCGWWLEDSNSVVRGWNMWFCFSNKVPQDAADPWTTLWVAMA